MAYPVDQQRTQDPDRLRKTVYGLDRFTVDIQCQDYRSHEATGGAQIPECFKVGRFVRSNPRWSDPSGLDFTEL